MQNCNNISKINNGASGLSVVVPAFSASFSNACKGAIALCIQRKAMQKKPGATTAHPWLKTTN